MSITSHFQDNQRKHIDFLDGMRAIASLFVLFSHTWYQIWPAVLPPFGTGHRPVGLVLILTGWLYYGHFAVVVFIVLSGFCLMIPVVKNNGFLKGGTNRFFTRRFKRILPPYYSALLLSVLLGYFFIYQKTGTQWDISIPITISGLLSHLLLAQDLVNPTEINYVFWSIALEFHLYLFFPLLVMSYRKFGSLRTTCIIGVLIYTCIFSLELIASDQIPPSFLGLCFYFVLGMSAANIVFSGRFDSIVARNHTVLKFCSLMSFLVTVILCSLWGFDKSEHNFAILDTFCSLGTFLLLITVSQPGFNRIRNFLSMRILVFVGTFSYSIYLVHAPMLQLIWQYALHPLKLGEVHEFILLVTVGSFLIICFSYIFFVFCEKPFLNK